MTLPMAEKIKYSLLEHAMLILSLITLCTFAAAEGVDDRMALLPSDPMQDLQEVNTLYNAYRNETIIRILYREPSYGAKLAIAVYRNPDEETPLLSWQEDDYFSEIPEERLASGLEEADTIVLIWPEYRSAGKYSSGAAAYRCITWIAVYDRVNDIAYVKEEAASDDPPRHVTNRLDHSGSFRPAEALRQLAERLAGT